MRRLGGRGSDSAGRRVWLGGAEALGEGDGEGDVGVEGGLEDELEDVGLRLSAFSAPNYSLPEAFYKKNASVNESVADPYYERNYANWSAVPLEVDSPAFSATWTESTKVLSLRALEALRTRTSRSTARRPRSST